MARIPEAKPGSLHEDSAEQTRGLGCAAKKKEVKAGGEAVHLKGAGRR